MAEKIWKKEVLGAKIWNWKVLSAYLKTFRGSGELDSKFGASRGVYVKDGRAMDWFAIRI
jgi:hypothetical protein